MEFGQVPYSELDKIDFTLPTDPVFNNKILNDKPRKSKVYVGLAKWGRQEWVGKLYPNKTKEKNFLDCYIQHFNSIEYNASHYKIFGVSNNQTKASKAKGKDFLYCPKMFQGVTHRGSLRGKKFLLNEFIRGVVGFENHLGPIFIQLSDTFSPKRKVELFEFLKSLPGEFQFFVEVRHPGWFGKPEIQEEYFSTLNELKIGSVITDTPGRRDCSHMHLTVRKTFVRYVSPGHPSDKFRINQWAQKINDWMKRGIDEIFFFIHMHDEANTPELAQFVINEFNKKCKVELKEIQLLK